MSWWLINTARSGPEISSVGALEECINMPTDCTSVGILKFSTIIVKRVLKLPINHYPESVMP